MATSSFLFGVNGAFIEQLYQRYLASPNTVDASWQQFFESLGDEAETVISEARGASWAPRGSLEPPADAYGIEGGASGVFRSPGALPSAMTAGSADDIHRSTRDSLQALMLIRAYRVRGHLHAKLDPLGLSMPRILRASSRSSFCSSENAKSTGSPDRSRFPSVIPCSEAGPCRPSR